MTRNIKEYEQKARDFIAEMEKNGSECTPWMFSVNKGRNFIRVYREHDEQTLRFEWYGPVTTLCL